MQAVFRLKKNANGPFRAFIRSALSADQIVVEPSATARAQLPDTLLRPCRVRLVKYTAGASSFALATTLLDAKAYPARALADLYHGRWSIEELYKISRFFSRTCGRGCVAASPQVYDIERVRRTCRIGIRTLS